MKTSGPSFRRCDGVNRRDFLHLGVITGLGLSLAEVLRLQSARAGEASPGSRPKTVSYSHANVTLKKTATVKRKQVKYAAQKAAPKAKHAIVIQPIQEYKVVGIVDGDTLDVFRGGKTIRVRLAEIDSPERGQAYSNNAKQFLSKMVFKKTVKVNVERKDKFGRHIAWITVDGKSANREMIAQGYAWAYRQYLTEYDLLNIEAKARQNRRGLWSQKNPTPPWNYRRVNTANSNRRYVSFE